MLILHTFFYFYFMFQYLAQNKIGDDGASEFAESLRENTTIRALYLQFNRISSPGVQDLASGISENTSLTELDLKGNKLTEGELLYITTALQGPREYFSRGMDKEEFSRRLREIKDNAATLHSIVLTDCSLLAPDAVLLGAALAANITVTELDVSDNHIGDAGLAGLLSSIATSATIHYLNVGNNELSMRSGEHIGSFLAKNRGLEILDLYNNDLGDHGTKVMCDSLPMNRTLKTLRMWMNNITNVGALAFLRVLSNETSLVEIDLGSNAIASDILERIEQILSSPRVLSGPGAAEINFMLQEMTLNIPLRTEVDLEDMDLDEKMAAALGKGMFFFLQQIEKWKN